ncbi:MAG TPA: hypothetical protein VGC29_01690 [Flavisolibacter sp.]
MWQVMIIGLMVSRLFGSFSEPTIPAVQTSTEIISLKQKESVRGVSLPFPEKIDPGPGILSCKTRNQNSHGTGIINGPAGNHVSYVIINTRKLPSIHIYFPLSRLILFPNHYFW